MTKKKEKRNAERRVVQTSAPAADTFTQSAQTICRVQRALGKARSPVGVPPRL
jgi:hypothetical protein